MGRRATTGGFWFGPTPWVLLAATASWIICMIRQVPCLIDWGKAYTAGCYNDITPLYFARGLSTGQIPYLDSDVEYPVLTGGLMELGRRLVAFLGGVSAPGVTEAQAGIASRMFFGVTALMLFGFFMLTIWAHLKMSRPWDALMIAISPVVMTEALINWDAMVLAFTSLGLLFWGRRRPWVAGIFIGLGVAAKLYPVLLLLPLAALCLRTSRWRAYGETVAGAALSWIAVNLPVYLATPKGWMNFWTFNVDRGADLGSLWYALRLVGIDPGDPSRLEMLALVVGGSAIGALLLLAPRRPRLSQGIFLLVTLFLIVNKVYSPQYALWLLPLLVLANPRWPDWTLFTIGEIAYFIAIWAHLAGSFGGQAEGGARIYAAFVFLRIGVQLWLCGRIVVDMLRPAGDVVRMGGLDDPDGGLFDHAPDATWLNRFVGRPA